MNLTKLFDPSYIFAVYPGEFKFMPLLIGFFVIILLSSFYIDQWIKRHSQRKSLEKLLPNFAGRLRLLSIVGFILLWLRYENLPYLSMRFFLLFFLLYVVWVLGNAVYLYKKRLHLVVARHHAIKETNKYLPRRKK